MAMIMSTTDSWINSGSVIFVHDLCKPLGIRIKNELLFSRIFTMGFGITAIFLALSVSGIFELVILTSSFYMPVVIPVLILSILGFRSTQRTYLISVVCAVIVVIFWKYLVNAEIDSVVPAMFTNLTVFLSFHYLLGEPGGWIGNKEKLEQGEEDQLKKKQSAIFS